MNFIDKLSAELNQLTGFSNVNAKTVSLSGPDQITIDIDFTAVDTMSSSIQEIRLAVPSLVNVGFDVLKTWAKNLSNRITYLLENIGPLELDPNSGQVLIRSTPPSQPGGGKEFYEMLLASHADGNFSLKRFLSQNNNPGRARVDIQATHELLKRLVTDLVETIPKATA